MAKKTDFEPTEEQKRWMERETAKFLAGLDRPPTPQFCTKRWEEKTGWPIGVRPDGTMNVVEDEAD